MLFSLPPDEALALELEDLLERRAEAAWARVFGSPWDGGRRLLRCTWGPTWAAAAEGGRDASPPLVDPSFRPRPVLALAVQGAATKRGVKPTPDLSYAILDAAGLPPEAVASAADTVWYSRPFASSGLWKKLDGEDLYRLVADTNGSTAIGLGDPRQVILPGSADNTIYNSIVRLTKRDGFFDEQTPGALFSDGILPLDMSDGVKFKPFRPYRKRDRIRETEVMKVPFPQLSRIGKSTACPTWERAFETWFKDAREPDGCRTAMLEWIALAVTGLSTQTRPSTLMLTGPERAGKSTFIDSILELWPHSARASVTLHQLAGKEGPPSYFLAALYGKRISASGELSSTHLPDATLWNQVASGDMVQARNPSERSFEFSPHTSWIFACNDLPPVKAGVSNAFWSRVVVIPFPASIEKGAVILDLREKLVRELPGLLEWALGYLGDAVQRKGIYTPRDHDITMKGWKADSDSVTEFLQEYDADAAPEEGEGEWVPAARFRAAYKAFCEEAGRKPYAARAVGARMKRLGRYKHTREGTAFLVPPEMAAFVNKILINERGWGGHRL